MSRKISSPDGDILHEKYINKGLSPNQIALDFSVSRPVVLTWLRENNIKMRGHKDASALVGENQKEQIRHGYEDIHLKLSDYDWLYNERIIKKKSKKNIAAELGCSPTIINKYLSKLNIPLVRYNESENSIKERLLNKEYLLELYNQGKTMDEIAILIESSKSTVSLFFKRLEIEVKKQSEYDPKFIKVSKAHQEIIDYIRSIYDGKILINNRSIFGVEMDIIIPEKMLCIEFNGLFYHSEDAGKDKTYHLSKTIKCEEKGYFLFHIFEDTWKSHEDVVLSMICNKLGKNVNKLHARKLKIREVGSSERRQFFENNHIQGKDYSVISYGLYDGETLVSCMSFAKSRYDKSVKWELMRFANKIYFNVVGGFSRLLNHFRKLYDGSIISFSDVSYSQGNIYRSNGFTLAGIIPPDYSYMKHFERRIRKENFRKNRLKSIFKDVDINMSEREIMFLNGYKRIWNCGMKKWVLM